MLKKVAVTGGLSCGKSSVCKILKDLGAYTVSADDIVHHLLLFPESPLGRKIVSLLGSEVIRDNHFDRTLIAKKVFKHPGLLKSYEQLIHPAVIDEIKREYNQVKIQGKYPLFVAEIPLLFEGHQDNYFDETITVSSTKSDSLKRFTDTTHFDAQEYERRMERQMPLHEKEKLATYVINNVGTLDDLRREAEKIYNTMITK
jgi:dephospho-CoA kinase